MRISTQTLLALVSAATVLAALARSPAVVAILLVYGFPFVMMIIGLTSPRSGNQLDPRGRWPLFLMFKTWIFSIIGIVLFFVFALLSPYWAERCYRALKGDTSAHQLHLYVPVEPDVHKMLQSTTCRLYDKHGEVGKITRVEDWTDVASGKVKRVTLVIAADRVPVVLGFGQRLKAVGAGKVLIEDATSSATTATVPLRSVAE